MNRHGPAVLLTGIALATGAAVSAAASDPPTDTTTTTTTTTEPAPIVPPPLMVADLACAAYGQCATLWRRARCETGGTFNPYAHNPSGASGLFQFKPGTFASTPYARLSIWSPYASALAAGWMFTHGRGGEWACR